MLIVDLEYPSDGQSAPLKLPPAVAGDNFIIFTILNKLVSEK